MSSVSPFCLSMISDSFPMEYKGRGAGLFTIGVYPGVGLSSLSLLLMKNVGWRNAYKIISGSCSVICILILFIREPQRGRYDNFEAKRRS